MNNFFIKKISSHKIISFDIFDTLLKRNVKNPHDIFTIVENKYNQSAQKKIYNFLSLRIAAEQKCKQLSTCEEVTLDSIYQYLPYDVSTKERLKKLELSIEEAFLIPNYRLQAVYEYAVKTGKEVIFVSDMYLPQLFIENILKKIGVCQISQTIYIINIWSN